jgi:hypothetical protein
LRLAFILGIVAAGIFAAGASAALRAGDRQLVCEAAAQPAGGANACYGTIPPVRTRVLLQSLSGSQEHGVAWITFGLHETNVVIRLKGAPTDVKQPARLYVGGCRGHRGIVYNLGNVVNGRRNVRIESLPRVTGFSIDVREHGRYTSAAVVACGVIPSR